MNSKCELENMSQRLNAIEWCYLLSSHVSLFNTVYHRLISMCKGIFFLGTNLNFWEWSLSRRAKSIIMMPRTGTLSLIILMWVDEEKKCTMTWGEISSNSNNSNNWKRLHSAFHEPGAMWCSFQILNWNISSPESRSADCKLTQRAGIQGWEAWIPGALNRDADPSLPLHTSTSQMTYKCERRSSRVWWTGACIIWNHGSCLSLPSAPRCLIRVFLKIRCTLGAGDVAQW